MILTKEKWNSLSSDLSKSMKLTEKETEWLKNAAIPRLIGVLPFEADCKQPERTAFVHLGTYLLSLQTAAKSYSNANPEDNSQPLDRLYFLGQFIGGNSAILKKGMALIGLSMLYDYDRDLEEDRKTGKYNPLAEENISFDEWSRILKEMLTDVKTPQIDEIVNETTIKAAWWQA